MGCEKVDALSGLSEDEAGLIQSYILRILAPMVKGAAKEAVQQWAKDLTGGPDMISNAAEYIRKAYYWSCEVIMLDII